MSFPTRYYHSVIIAPYETMGYPSSAAYETSVTREGDGTYVHRSYDAATGREHERYFDSLREFVVWHYSVAGVEVDADTYAWEKEAKVHRFPAGGAVMRRVEFFEPLTPISIPNSPVCGW